MPQSAGLYSRTVAVLKIGLPLIALGLLSSLFFTRIEKDLGGEVSFSEVDLAALGSGLRVDNPVFSGATQDNDQFEFRAGVVVPDAAPPSRASIEKIQGKIDFDGGGIVTLSAVSAELQIDEQILELFQSARISTSEGFVVVAPKVTLDLRIGSLLATGGVETTGPMGDVTSEELSIDPNDDSEAGHLISFEGGVRLVYQPESEAK